MNGSLVLVKIGNYYVAGQLDGSISMTMGLEPVIVNGGRLQEYMPTKYDASIDVTVIYDSPDQLADLFEAFRNGDEMIVRFGDYDNYGNDYQATCVITDLSLNAPRNGLATIAVKFKVVGNLILID